MASAVRWGDGTTAPVSEVVASEVPVALVYNGVDHVVMMVTPENLDEFAVGFSLSEGIVDGVGDVTAIRRSDLAVGIRLELAIPEPFAERLFARQRNLAGRTGCGLCGIARIEDALRPLPPAPSVPALRAAAIDRAVLALPAWQVINQATGSVHAAAFADRDGAIRAVREDVGRHNALDKLIGAVAAAGWNPAEGFALVTSRCSMEMVQKAVTAGFAILASISAPTALAIDLAEGAGLTLAAFARGDGCTLYAHPDRIRP
ncbi:MAG: formate dehydrogenase accessory sulfurtransferase FdhD [Alphaproteobacteria bacterium]|nr:formate dehydrogenase accessory sulfurtransferase FdhD [Alphaproteobacteria bacterium]